MMSGSSSEFKWAKYTVLRFRFDCSSLMSCLGTAALRLEQKED